jgi:type IV pilus assembly protein PilV
VTSFRHPARGFTLLEALVALVVLSAGLLGMAALHAQALSLGRAAQLRSHAVDLAADMAERIRASRNERDAYGATGLDAGSVGSGGSEHVACDGAIGEDAIGEESDACPPVPSMASELLRWRQEARRLLPAGEAEARRATENGASARYVIELRWDEVGAGRVAHRLEIRLAGE